ncbi:MAG: cytochrome P460 family protein [Candidatus Sulfotelmatobacter sp.]
MQRIAGLLQRALWSKAGSPRDTAYMISKTRILPLIITLLACAAAFSQYSSPSSSKQSSSKQSSPSQVSPSQSMPGPEYTSDAQLKFPENYRQWVYVTTGFDMSYSPAMQMDHHMFDNVFVNPEAYKAFVETGTWPDKTMLVLEVRGAIEKGSINKSGNFQGSDVMGVEVHVKDEKRFPEKWAFFGFGDAKTAKMTPTTATCYTCHAEHAAVDRTFVQFYPTLLPIAKAKGTLSAAYQKESLAAEQK